MGDVSPSDSQRINPLLARIQLPGETFTLPSGGIFYTNDEIDNASNAQAEIRVHPMTAIDEIAMRTPDMLFSGDAVRQVFARCIPQIKNTDALLAKDVDFLLIALRKVSYGSDMQVEFKHDCDNAKTHTYTIDISNFIKNAKRIDPTTVSKNFSVAMPNDQVVKMHPITYKQFVDIMQTMNKDADEVLDSAKLAEVLINSLLGIITSIDEVSDRDMIREWLSKVPPRYLNLINSNIDKTLEWGAEFTAKVKCKDCGKMMSIIAPMNPLSFFT